jgi:hypothetical protein
MPSVKNPNAPSKNRLAARAAKQRKQRQKAAAAGQLKKVIAKGDMRRGARPGLLPTSGPRKPVSAKRQRKLERKMGYALKRKMEAELAEGEVVMKGGFSLSLSLSLSLSPPSLSLSLSLSPLPPPVSLLRLSFNQFNGCPVS